MSKIYGGASTFSKMPHNYPEGHVCRTSGGMGNYMYDGNERPFFDTVSALGARLIDCDGEGVQSVPSDLESIVADQLIQHFPFIEMVRYGCNGADATEGAIRYARAFTGKPLIFSVGYHSCQSAFTYNTSPALGCFYGGVQQFDNFKALIKELRNLSDSNTVAAVIIEPVMLDLDVEEDLINIRSLTRQLGILLVYDEIITGFRFPKRCVANLFGIYPDMILLGKALGGGYPLSVIGGSKEVMNVPVFHSYTFAGLPHALAYATSLCTLPDSIFNDFWCMCADFIGMFNKKIKNVKLLGYPTRCVWKSETEETMYAFWQLMMHEGYYLGPVFFPKMKWSIDDFGLLGEASEKCDKAISDGYKLKGEKPKPIFSRNQK